MERKENKVYSETTNSIVSRIDYDLEEGYFDYVCYYDASVKDVVDAMEVILNKRWFGSRPLYARKIVCTDDANSYLGNDLAMAIKFAKKPEDFEAYETENNSFVIDTFPTICGIWENNGKASDTAVVRIFEDGQYYSYEEWTNKHHMNLESRDPVVLCRESFIPAFEKTMNTAYYTGEQTTDEKTGETLWEFAERLDLDQYRDKDHKRSTFYCKHGVDVAKTHTSNDTYFLSFPEFRFQLNCFAEAAKKAQTILERRMGTSKK